MARPSCSTNALAATVSPAAREPPLQLQLPGEVHGDGGHRGTGVEREGEGAFAVHRHGHEDQRLDRAREGELDPRRSLRRRVLAVLECQDLAAVVELQAEALQKGESEMPPTASDSTDPIPT